MDAKHSSMYPPVARVMGNVVHYTPVELRRVPFEHRAAVQTQGCLLGDHGPRENLVPVDSC